MNKLENLMPTLGTAVGYFLSQGSPDSPPQVTYEELSNVFSQDGFNKEELLTGVLSILSCLGFLRVSDDKIEPTSRNAYFALASLSKFLKEGMPVVDWPIDENERDYLINMTKSLEKRRLEKGGEDVDSIHRRRIVNVIITSKQVREGHKQPVYLHKYHKDWESYHLIGLSKKKPDETDSVIAAKAMERHLGLFPNDYELDPAFNPPDIVLPPRVSETSGAITEYTYRVYRIKELRNRLDLPSIISQEIEDAKRENRTSKFDQKSFRWFTKEEIIRGYGAPDEPIMFSSPEIIGQIDFEAYPINAPDAVDIRREIDIMTEIGSRITFSYIARTTVVILFGLVIALYSTEIMNALGTQSVLYDNLIKLFALLFSGINVYLAYRRLR